MREIKLRAWDKTEGELVPVGAIYMSRDYEAQGISVHLSSGMVHTRNVDDVELMQYTGEALTDGTEIYDGDIVKRKTHIFMYGSSLNKWVEEHYKVEWKYGGWYIGEEPLHFAIEAGTGQDGFKRTELTLAGNIYEHPHLLEV